MRAGLIALLTLLPSAAAAETITVFAAASLKGPLDQAAQSWGAASGNAVVISYAASSALAKQITAGAPADLFISADQAWMDYAAGAVRPETRVDLFGNRLVLVGHEATEPVTLSQDTDLKALLGGGKLAMALVETVPAGVYGKAALTHLGLWDQVKDAVAQGDNVRAALAYVAAGEAPLGVVYASDARAEPRVHLLATFPEASHDPIRYPAALTTEAKPETAAFLAYLGQAEAQKTFISAGFSAILP